MRKVRISLSIFVNTLTIEIAMMIRLFQLQSKSIPGLTLQKRVSIGTKKVIFMTKMKIILISRGNGNMSLIHLGEMMSLG